MLQPIFLRPDLSVPEDGERTNSEVRDRITTWVNGYLCAPNSDLGRAGPVCPYAEGALERGTFQVTISSACDSTQAASEIEQYRLWFAERTKRAGRRNVWDALVVAFPAVDTAEADRWLGPLQQLLKPAFVAEGLMLGQFYEGCPEGGIRNPDFRPLRSPVPLLAIRQMVPSDYPFLVMRSEYLLAYLDQFAADVPPRIRHSMADAIAHRVG